MIEGPGSRPRKRGKGKGRIERIMGLYRSIYRRMPEDSRNRHNPKDPVQAERIAAAQVKRDRKATKAMRDSARAWVNNHAWMAGMTMQQADRLRPFTINREVQ